MLTAPNERCRIAQANGEKQRIDFIQTARVIRTGTFGELSGGLGNRNPAHRCALIEFDCSRTRQKLRFTTHLVQSEWDQWKAVV